MEGDGGDFQGKNIRCDSIRTLGCGTSARERENEEFAVIRYVDDCTIRKGVERCYLRLYWRLVLDVPLLVRYR